MSDRPLKKVEVPSPVEIDLMGATVVDFRDVTEEEDDIHPCSSRDGGCFLIFELTTGERHDVFCPFLISVPDPADYGEDDGIPGLDPADYGEDDGIPGEDEAPAAEAEETEFTPKDLHTMIMSHVNATPPRLSVTSAKRVFAHFKVARAQDLTNEQALEGKAIVEKMVAAVSDLDRS